MQCFTLHVFLLKNPLLSLKGHALLNKSNVWFTIKTPFFYLISGHGNEWCCRGSLLLCDNWRIDLDERIHSRINQSIATDCRTFQPGWPSPTAYITEGTNEGLRG